MPSYVEYVDSYDGRAAMDYVINNPVNFENLEVGQQSVYLSLKTTAPVDGNYTDNFEYQNDTLVIDIIDEDENGFLVKEYKTPLSESQGEAGNFHPDDPNYYYLKIVNDSLHYSPTDPSTYFESELLGSGLRILPLSTFTNQEATIVGWTTTLSIYPGMTTAFTPSFELFGYIYEDLNIFIDNRYLHWDANGVTFVYSRTHGFIRTTHVFYESGAAGWDLLIIE